MAGCFVLALINGSEGIKGGSYQFSLETSADISVINPELALSVGEKIIMGKLVVENNKEEHIGTVTFQLPEIAPFQQTKIILLGEVSSSAIRHSVQVYREFCRTLNEQGKSIQEAWSTDRLSNFIVVR